MPLYDGLCPECNVVEIYKGMNEPWPKRCPKCGGREFYRQFNNAVALHAAADQGWENENGGAGHYMGQLGRLKRPDGTLNPDTHCRSRAEAIDKFKRRGYDDISPC